MTGTWWKTTDKTDNLRKWHPVNPFSKENQPDPSKKKEWRARKKQAQELMDKILAIQWLTYAQLRDMLDSKNPEAVKLLWEMTVQEVLCLKYIQEVMKWKLLVDFMNRHIAYAPQDVNLWVQEGIKQIKIDVIKWNQKPNDTE